MKKNRKKTDLQNLPACAAEFIKLVIKKMRYRKKVRADVQAELEAHFEDELKDCKTDAEKEQRAQQLIEDFGDVKLLGILLRRAKKRCRPLWRTIIARTFQTTGVLILCLIIYVTWFLTGKPVITTDYVAELNKIARPVADDSLNAAPLYHKAAEFIENLPDDMKELLSKKYNEATPEQKQLIRKWLADNEEIFELVIAGTQKPYYWQKYEEGKEREGMMSVLLPHLAEFRRLVYSLRWRIWLSAEQGQYQAAVDDIKSCYRFGQHIRGGKTIIEQLVAIAIEAAAVLTLRDILGEYQLDSDTLATLQQDLEQMIADKDFTVNIEFEKLFVYDEIQRSFTEDRLGGGHLYIPRVSSLGYDTSEAKEKSSIYGSMGDVDFEAVKKGLHALFTHPNKQQTKETADRLYDFFDKFANRTPAELRAESIDVEAQAMEIVKGNLLLEILIPAIWRINEISHRLKADTYSTLTITAILRYAQDRGHYPDNLDELIAADYLKELPMDPWSGKPLVYKRTDDGFMLYGIGSNFKDDGGQVARDDNGKVKSYADEGDWVFWPVQK